MPFCLQRKKPQRQLGKNGGFTDRPDYPRAPEAEADDDPALELMRQGLITIRNVKPRGRLPLNSPLDGAVLRDLDNIHLNIIEPPSRRPTENNMFEAKLKSHEILEAAEDQLQRLRRVHLDDPKGRARRKAQQMRLESWRRLGGGVGGANGLAGLGGVGGLGGSKIEPGLRTRGLFYETDAIRLPPTQFEAHPGESGFYPEHVNYLVR